MSAISCERLPSFRKPAEGDDRRRSSMLTYLTRHARARITALGQRRMVREGLWVVAGHGVTLLTGLISIRLFTELAPQSVFGGANLLIGMLTLGMNALVAPIAQTQIRYHSAYNDAGVGDRYTRIVARLAALAALLIASLMTVLLLGWPALRVGGGATIVGWLAIWIAVSTCRGVLINRVHAERQQKRYALWLASEAVLTMVATATALFLWPTVEGYIAGQVCGAALATIGFARLPKRRAPTTDSERRALGDSAWRQFATYGLPFLPFALLGWLSNFSDRYVLAALLDTASVGQYVAAFGIANRLPVCSVVCSTICSGQLCSRRRAVARRRGPSGYSQSGFSCSGPASRGCWFCCFSLRICWSTPCWPRAIDQAPRRSCCGSPPDTAAPRLGRSRSIDLSTGNSRVLIWTKLAGAGANIALAALLIPIMGVIGAAQANAAGQVFQLLAALWFWRSLRCARAATGQSAAVEGRVSCES